MKKYCSFIIVFYFSFSLFATIPQGYYTTLNGKHSAALKTELHNILMADTILLPLVSQRGVIVSAFQTH